MPNESKKLSDAGWTALRMREGAVLHYYDDVADNCTFGIGTLAHFGRCTTDELRRPVTLAEVNSQLAEGIRTAQGAVKAALGTMS
ncbi:hypothetical protein [Paraburkholderia atlantica]|uniref:hypothetical protein n=1 Tax=Paraburkholderia atlantica TaxID=2654982 RepID=UPI0017ADC256|nr:hypothetical protein [Paraburkholderia atlantica]MBB5506330.1 hypothetical protein [Paraburkholderia atlantica]